MSAAPTLTRGQLVIDDDLHVLMVIDTHDGLYGRQTVDCVPADDTYQLARSIGVRPADALAIGHVASTCELWLNPLAYFSSEVSVIDESEESE